MSGSALLVFNRSSGVGHGAADAERIAEAIHEGAATVVETAVVGDHLQARAAAAAFVTAAARPALVVAAGGGGTLRAVVEGIMDVFPDRPPGPDVLCLGALRMGSGNVIARRLGVPLDPLQGARQIALGFVRGVTRRCAVLRCRHGGSGGTTVVRHALTMAGFGAWGRVPGDLERWRRSHARFRRRAASWIGLERVNGFEYLLVGMQRMLAGTVRPSECERVEVDGRPPFRLLAAAALNLPIPPIPDPRVDLGDEAAGMIIFPRMGRPWRRRVEPGHPLRLTLLDRESVEFFLDEDPEVAYGWIELEVPGLLAVVPGEAP